MAVANHLANKQSSGHTLNHGRPADAVNRIDLGALLAMEPIGTTGADAHQPARDAVPDGIIRTVPFAVP